MMLSRGFDPPGWLIISKSILLPYPIFVNHIASIGIQKMIGITAVAFWAGVGQTTGEPAHESEVPGLCIGPRNNRLTPRPAGEAQRVVRKPPGAI